MKDKNLFVVLANRYGDNEQHTYLVGVFDEERKAAAAAVAEEYWRGGKYECVILGTRINKEFCDETSIQEKDKWLLKNVLSEPAYQKAIDEMLQANKRFMRIPEDTK